MEIEILNWEKYNPRGDAKRPSWFRMENSLFDNPEFYGFTPGELLAWIYILTCASKKNAGVVKLHIEHLERAGRVLQSDLQSALTKLVELRIVKVNPCEPRTDSCEPRTYLPATNERTLRTNTIAHPKKMDERVNFQELEQIYQKYPRKLGKLAGVKKLKVQIKTQEDLKALEQAVSRFVKYHADRKTEPDYIPYFSTFVSNWRDWLEPNAGRVELKPKQADEDEFLKQMELARRQ